jgi:tetratricopeptide (TPR) repeat protein
MRLALLGCVTIVGGMSLPPVSSFADSPADFALCTTPGDLANPAVADACDRLLATNDTTAADRAAAYTARSRIAATDQDYRSALDDIGEAIRLAPTALAYLYSGYYRTLLGDRDAAIADFGRAIAIDPTADAYYLRGKAYAAGGEHRKAIADLNHAIPLVPGEIEPHRIRGDSFEALGAHDRAISEFSLILGLNDRDAAAFASRAASYLAKGDAAAAIIDYSAALDVKPDWTYLTGRGRAYRDAAQPANAVADLTLAAKQHPAAAVYLSLGDTYAAIGNAADADASYEKGLALAAAAVRSNPSAAAYYDRAMANTALRRFDAAIKDLDEAIRLNTEIPDWYLARGNAYAAIGETARADADRARASALKAVELARANAPPDDKLASESPSP